MRAKMTIPSMALVPIQTPSEFGPLACGVLDLGIQPSLS